MPGWAGPCPPPRRYGGPGAPRPAGGRGRAVPRGEGLRPGEAAACPKRAQPAGEGSQGAADE